MAFNYVVVLLLTRLLSSYTMVTVGGTVSCPDGWVGPSSRDLCFHGYSSSEKNYTVSTKYCRDLGGVLWMPKFPDDYLEALDLIESRFQTDKVWIGVQRTTDGLWTWQDGTTTNDTGYEHWEPGEPRESKDCVRTDDSMWNSKGCGTTQDILCQRVLVLYDCPEGWFRNNISRECYLYDSRVTYMTYEDALGYCAYYGGEVLAPKTKEENVVLVSWMVGPFSAWIGLTDAVDEGSWKWNDGLPLEQAFWALGQPDNAMSYSSTGQDCVIIANSADGYWYDMECVKYKRVVCQCTLPTPGDPVPKDRVICAPPESEITASTTPTTPASTTSLTTLSEAAAPETTITTITSETTTSTTTPFSSTTSTTTPFSYTTSTTTPFSYTTSTTTRSSTTILTASPSSSTASTTILSSTSAPVTTIITPTPCVTQSSTINPSSATSPFTDVSSSTLPTQDKVTPMCRCACKTFTEEELENKLNNLTAATKVDKKGLTSSIRKLTCADDPRPSARSVGFIGVVLMATVGAFMLVLDLIPRK